MKAVIFDLDGTIVYSHPTHFRAYELLFKDFGITWTFREFNDMFAGTGAPTIIRVILERNGIKNEDIPALVKKKRDLFNALLKEKSLETVKGFHEFLDGLNKDGMARAIASGSNRQNIIKMLENIDVLNHFPFIVSGEEVPNPKPSPDIFLAAAKLIGVDPVDCLVMEDTAHGVLAAKAAGMKCIALSTSLDPARLKEAGADKVVADYTEIEDIHTI